MIIFIDTSAFVALTNRDDQFHGDAKRFINTSHIGNRFITTNYVIDESITRIRMTAGWKKALTFGKDIFSSDLLQLRYINEESEKEAFALFEKYRSIPFSFTDCTSFVTMKKDGIKSAFTFDEHFRKIGFQMLPEPR